MILYILLAILIFGLLIMTHELGHFAAAKLFGVRVNEFSICMGPAIWKKTVGETTYALRCIPIGGYCAMEGEDEASEDPRAFTSAKPWKRAIILVAGSVMNFVTGLIILVCMYSAVAGFNTPEIVDFYPDCPLHSDEGLQIGDEIYKIDGHRIYQYSNVGTYLGRNTTGVFDLVIKRDGKLLELNDFPMEKTAYQDENGETVYLYGLYFGFEEKTVGTVLKNAWYSAIDFVRLVWMSLSDLVRGMISIDDMSGPVGIVSIIAETGETSATTADAAINIAYLGAFIAVNLAVMNMLPIPALDGGRVFFLLVTWIVEKIIRRRINPKYEAYIHAAGMILLLAFIAFVTCKDIWKLFTA